MRSAQWRQFVAAQMHAKLAEAHHHGVGGADRASLPVVEHADDLALLAIEIEALAPVLGVVKDHHAAADLDLVPWLHDRRHLLRGKFVMAGSAAAGRFGARFDHLAAKRFAGALEGAPFILALADALLDLGVEFLGGHRVGQAAVAVVLALMLFQ